MDLDLNTLLGCRGLQFIDTLMTPHGLSAISDQQVHIFRETLVSNSQVKSFFEIIGSSSSLFNLFVPSHPMINIDIFVKDATSGTAKGSSNGFGDEYISITLSPGKYFIHFIFSPRSGSSPPPQPQIAPRFY
jgi:hypothetical protein